MILTFMRMATAIALLQLATASILDLHRHRLYHPWSMAPDWFDRPLQLFNSHLLDSDPFHDSFFDDELPFPSIHSLLTDDTRKPTQLENQLKFNIDTQGFRPKDLTLRLQGQDLIVKGEKTICGFSSCYKHHYSVKRRLPRDVDLDTIKARLTERGDLQIEADRQGWENEAFSQFPPRNNDGCPLSQRKSERVEDDCRGWNMRRKPASKCHGTPPQRSRKNQDDSDSTLQENSKGHKLTRNANENNEEMKEDMNIIGDYDDEATVEVLPEIEE